MSNDEQMQFNLELPKKEKKDPLQAAIDRVEFEMIPALNKEGFVFEWIHDHTKKDGNRTQPKPHDDFRDENDINYRLAKEGYGMLAKIYHKGNPEKFIFVQPKVVKNIDAKFMKNYPHWNMSGKAVKLMEDEGLDVKEATLDFLDKANIHFFILSLTGTFWINRYANEPEHHWDMTWRKHADRLDRLCFVPMFQKGNWLFIEQSLKETLLQLIENANK